MNKRPRLARLRDRIDEAFLDIFSGLAPHASPANKQRGTMAQKRLKRLAADLTRILSH